MPRMRITDLGRRHLYLRRDMIAEDGTAEIEANVVEAARALGYVEDVAAEPAAPAPRRRGRPPKASAAPPLEEKTVSELREMAEEQGVELPSGYVKKEELVEMLEEAKTEQGDEDLT